MTVNVTRAVRDLDMNPNFLFVGALSDANATHAFLERLAITLWYFDADEHARAHAKGVAADQADAREAEALERAIHSIEGRYGSTVQRD